MGRKMFSLGSTLVAYSRVHHSTDLLFVPRFPFQRLQNLSKSSGLKERREEDARLNQIMSGGKTTTEVTIQESNLRSSCVYKFHPVDEAWRKSVCEVLNLTYHGENGVTQGGQKVCLKRPVSIKRILGDGNCFYKSIVYILTGSQDEHLIICRAIVRPHENHW